MDVTVGTLGQDDSLPSASFDVVTLWDVIEHVPEPLATLRRAHNLLSRDRVIAIQTPNIGGLFPRMSYLVARRLDYWPHPEPPVHLFQFSTRTLDRLLRTAGFRIDSIKHASIPLTYSFGDWNTLRHSPKRMSYALAFAPLAAIGPSLRMGDALLAIARKV